MLDTYRDALRTRGAVGFLLPCLIGRLGIGMTNLGIIWLIHARTGSYALAGTVTGCLALAEVTCSPVIARVIDRRGQGRVLPWSITVHACGVILLVVVASTDQASWALVAAGGVMGATIPQYGSLSAARWSALITAGQTLQAAFALEAMGNDLTYLLGPTLATTASALLLAPAGTLLAGLSVVIGGALLIRQHATDPHRGRDPLPCSAGSAPQRLPVPARLLTMLLVANLGLGFAFGSLQVAVTAFAQVHHAASLAGPMYATMSVGSLAAGYFVGRRSGPPRPVQLACSLTLLAGGIACLALAHNPIELAIGLLVPGAAVAPTIIIAMRLTQAAIPTRVRSQAFIWQNAASAIAASIAATLTGSLVDGRTPQVAIPVAAALTALTAAALWALATIRLRSCGDRASRRGHRLAPGSGATGAGPYTEASYETKGANGCSQVTGSVLLEPVVRLMAQAPPPSGATSIAEYCDSERIWANYLRILTHYSALAGAPRPNVPPRSAPRATVGP
jgi:MFS family permease